LNVRREGLIPKLSEEDRSCLYGLVWCRSGKDVILLFFVRPNSFVLATGGLRGLIFSRFLRRSSSFFVCLWMLYDTVVLRVVKISIKSKVNLQNHVPYSFSS
jgi:hypothetical protein